MDIQEQEGAEFMARLNPENKAQETARTIPSFEINGNEAEVFLKIFTEGDPVTFQTLPEQEGCRNEGLTKTLHGSLPDHLPSLAKLNSEGAGIFYTVNATDLKGRRLENIIGIRSVFVDLDGASLEPILSSPLEPHAIVESSPGRYHAYWIVEGVTLAEFSNIQKLLAEKFNGDKAVHDLPRLMRLPGFFHLKKTPFRSKVIHQSQAQPYDKQLFLDGFEIGSISISPPKKQDTSEDKILNELIRRNMVIKHEAHPQGCHTIQCPWHHLHTKQDHGTKYFEPSSEWPMGGFQCFHSHCNERTLKDLLQFLDMKVMIEPLPLHRSIDVPQPFPMDALGEILGNAAMALHHIIRAPDAICAQSILGAAALVCQPFANIEIDGRTMPLSLFLLTVAESGDRKTATDNAALGPIYDYQKMLQGVYREDMMRYQNEYDRWEAKKKEALKNPNDKQVFDERPPIPPLRPLMLIEEPTYQGLVKYFPIGQPSVGIFSDEGGKFIGGHSMNRENQIQTIASLSSLWDGKPISWMRAGDGDMILYGRRVSLHLMIQEIILEELMGSRFLENQGFLPRCLIAFPITTAGNRSYVERNYKDDPALYKYRERINDLLDRQLPVQPLPAPQNELHPRTLHLVAQAKKRWIKFHDEIDQQLAPKQKLEFVKRFASKAAEHVLRLAGIFAIIEQPNTNQIEENHIERGITLVNYYLSEILRIQGYLMINPELALAQKTLEHFWERGQSIVTLVDVYQKGPSAIRQAKKARDVMRLLQEHGWAEPCSQGIEIEGKKHREAWRIRAKNFE